MTQFPPLTPPAQALIIDLDGSTADTYAAMQGAVTAIAGRELAPEEFLGFLGESSGMETAVWQALGLADEEALHQWYTCYGEAHTDLSPFPHLHETLAQARRLGLKTGLLTGKPRRSTLITLDGLQVTALLDAIVSGDEAPAPKPDPAGLLLVLDRLGVTPERAVFIGDSLADAGAALSAGVHFAAMLWSEQATIRQAPEGAGYALHSADDLPALIDAITAAAPSR